MTFGGTQSGTDSLSGSSDVYLNDPTDNDVLAYDSTSAKWINKVESSQVDNQTVPQPLGIPTPGASSKAAPADHVHPAPTLNNLDDINLTGISDGDILQYDNASGKFVAAQPPSGSSITPIWDTVTGGQITIPRTAASSDFIAPGNQTLHLTFFIATAATTVGHIGFQTGNAGTTGTSTIARVGLYSVDSTSNNLTLIASSANLTTGFTGAYATFNEALTASVTLTAGATYAVGILQSSDTTTATLMGIWQNNQFLGLRPRLGATVSGQADLPASLTDSQLADHQLAVFAALRS